MSLGFSSSNSNSSLADVSNGNKSCAVVALAVEKEPLTNNEKMVPFRSNFANTPKPVSPIPFASASAFGGWVAGKSTRPQNA